jgi:hypothetical protein
MSENAHYPTRFEYDDSDCVVVEAGVRDVAHLDRTANDCDGVLLALAPEMAEAILAYADRHPAFIERASEAGVVVTPGPGSTALLSVAEKLRAIGGTDA